MKLRACTLARVAIGLLVAAGVGGCKERGGESSAPVTGTWRSEDGVLLLRVFANHDVEWHFAAGGGSCVFLAEGTVDESDGVLVSEFDDEYPYAVAGDELAVDDPEGQLGGSFARVTYRDVCFVHVPALGAQSARVLDLALGESVDVQGGVGRAISIEVPANAVSFGFYAFGDTLGTQAAFGALFAPDGTNVLDEGNEPLGEAESDIHFCTYGFCSVVVPKETNVLPTAGTWTAVLVANTAEDLAEVSVRGLVREGPFEPTTFSLRPFVTTDVVSGAQIEDALDAIATLFDSMYGVTFVVEPIVVIEGGPADLVQDFLQPDTAAVMGMGDPDSINLFFARRLLGVGGLLGIASGIPASHGVAGPFDGLLIHLQNHLDGEGDVVAELLEETIAHEIGHMLGLYHPTESNAAYFDPIADTPECRLFDPSPLVTANDHDLDMDGTVYADECADAGGDNLMFWTPGTTTGEAVVQRTLTSDQVFVLERSLAGP
jgi:hypothetical protein